MSSRGAGNPTRWIGCNGRLISSNCWTLFQRYWSCDSPTGLIANEEFVVSVKLSALGDGEVIRFKCVCSVLLFSDNGNNRLLLISSPSPTFSTDDEPINSFCRVSLIKRARESALKFLLLVNRLYLLSFNIPRLDGRSGTGGEV
jgi:hypothetical protein